MNKGTTSVFSSDDENLIKSQSSTSSYYDNNKNDPKNINRKSVLISPSKLLTSKENFHKKPKTRTRNSLNQKTRKKISIRKNSQPVDLCLYSLQYPPNQRNNDCLNYIANFLKSMPSFMNIISKENNKNLEDKLTEEIALHLRHEFVPKNNVVVKYGERGEKFYIILKGKVTFLVPQQTKCYLNREEYINYLMQLRNNNEAEILHILLVENRIIYPIENDDFDTFLANEVKNYKQYLNKKNNKNVDETINITINEENNNNNDDSEIILPNKKNCFTKNTYQKMLQLHLKIISHEIKKVIDASTYNNTNSPNNYIKNTFVNLNLDKKNRKLVTVYYYQEMNYLEGGQTFGFIALEKKNCKRAATAITLENSDLGVLTKEEYLRFLAKISNKEKQNLYELLLFYNILDVVSNIKFINKYCHMFEYMKFNKYTMIMEENKPINSIYVFNSGSFIMNINKNLFELNDLISKLKTIRGNILGLTIQKIENNLTERKQSQDILMKKNYMPIGYNKEIMKSNNYTLTMISNHFMIGFADTVDPETHLPYFNCKCLAVKNDGYEIKNEFVETINKEKKVLGASKQFILLKLEYNIKRLQKFRDEVIARAEAKLYDSYDTSNIKTNTNDDLNTSTTNPNNNNSPIPVINHNISRNYLRRNSLYKKHSISNQKYINKNILNFDIIQNVLSERGIKNSENKSSRNLLVEKSTANNIQKLRESIMHKEKSLELKKQQSLKYIEMQNRHKKTQMTKMEKDKSILSLNLMGVKDLDLLLKNEQSKNSKKFLTINNNCNNNDKIKNIKNFSKDLFLTLANKNIDLYKRNNYFKSGYKSNIKLLSSKLGKLTKNISGICSIDSKFDNNIHKRINSDCLNPSELYILYKSPKEKSYNYNNLFKMSSNNNDDKSF